MKKIILLLTVIGIVFSSCNGKYTIAKRKYNKGFYVSRSSDNNTKSHQVTSNRSNKNNSTETKPATQIVAGDDTEILPLLARPISDAVVSSGAKKSHPKSLSKQTSELASVQPQFSKPMKTIKALSISNNTSQAGKKGSNDTNLIVEIILCFFWWFNLIAVYLHDGKSITLNFWITLLLDLTIIGGVIFALLVVLDVVDLK